jgi:hypothetical protein
MGPDMSDVLTMLAMTAADLNLRIVIQLEPRVRAGVVTGLHVTLRTTPKTEPGNIWLKWRPLDHKWEWSPEASRTFPAALWHALFALYSTDFPSDWPSVEQLPLP